MAGERSLGVGGMVRLWWLALVRGALNFSRRSNLTFAASISYYTLLSIFPFLLLVLSIMSHIVVPDSETTLLAVVTAALPSQFDFFAVQIQQLERMHFQFGIAGTVLLVWSATGMFGALTSAVNHVWDVPQAGGYLKQKLMAFVMFLIAGALMVVALMMLSTAQVVQATWFAKVLHVLPALGPVRGVLLRHMPMPMFMAVVALVYRYAPAVHVRWRDVWLGAALAGLLWRLAFGAFTTYVRMSPRFTVHGGVAAVVAFLIWIYVSAVIVLYGAEVSSAYASLTGASRPAPRPAH